MKDPEDYWDEYCKDIHEQELRKIQQEELRDYEYDEFLLEIDND